MEGPQGCTSRLSKGRVRQRLKGSLRGFGGPGLGRQGPPVPNPMLGALLRDLTEPSAVMIRCISQTMRVRSREGQQAAQSHTASKQQRQKVPWLPPTRWDS